MQIACGGNYMSPDHITEKSVEYFEQIQQRCCMHCSVGLGLATRPSTTSARNRTPSSSKDLAWMKLLSRRSLNPSAVCQTWMTKAELLLCAVLDMKLRTQLDDESCPKALALDTFRQVKDLVIRVVTTMNFSTWVMPGGAVLDDLH